MALKNCSAKMHTLRSRSGLQGNTVLDGFVAVIFINAGTNPVGRAQ